MPEHATKGKTQSTAGRDEGRSGPMLPALQVRYFYQLKPQRVATAVVFWQKTDKPPRGEVTVRLIVAGAQVLPSEQIMDAAKPDVKAVFYVTPLAKGWLRNQKLEVLSQGRKVQEIPLASKVVSQRFTWFLLLLTFLVPWFFIEHVKNSSLGKSQKTLAVDDVEKVIKDNVPHTPDFLKGSAIETGLKNARTQVSQFGGWLVQVSRIEPIGTYLGGILLGMTLISAYIHKPKRRQATGAPIPAAPGKNVAGED